jgi:DNA-binding transcriptional LysR family regulator
MLVTRLAPGFLAAHPHVQLELVGEDGLVDIVAQHFDAGIRVGHLVEPDMVATRLTPNDRYVVVGSPALVRKHGRPKHPHQLSEYPCVSFRRDTRAVEPWRFVVAGQPVQVSVEGRLMTNDVEACIQAVLRGVGLFCFPRSLVRRHLKDGSMKSVLDEYAAEVPGLYLYYPSRSQTLPKLKAFIAFVRASSHQLQFGAS